MIDGSAGTLVSNGGGYKELVVIVAEKLKNAEEKKLVVGRWDYHRGICFGGKRK